MTTFKAVCLKRHELTSKLDSLHQCRATLAEYNVATKGVDGIIESKTREIEGLTLDIEDRKERLKLYQRVSFEMVQKHAAKPERVELFHDRGERDVATRRAKFQAAGMSTADSIAFVPDYDPTAVAAEFASRRAIGDGWRKFAESGLAADLPANAPELLEELGNYPVNIKVQRLEG
jgi:hypothetical protein